MARVMDSIEVFQEKYHRETGAYGVGRYDRVGGDKSITDRIGWKPSTRDGTVYIVESITPTQYQVTAISQDGESISRVYPTESSP